MNYQNQEKEKTARAQKAVQKAIKEYDLLDCDFYETDKGKICLSLAGCKRINTKLPKAKKFDPMAVEYVFAPDGGCAFLYRSKEQGIFITGSASSLNSRLPFPVEQAASRVFCRYITDVTGLSEDGIYTEVEAEDFAMSPQNDPVFIPRQDPEPTARASAPKQKASSSQKAPQNRKLRIAKLSEAIAKTNTDLDALLNHYKIDDLTEMSDNDLQQCENIIFPRLKKQSLAKAKQEIAETASPAPSEDHVPDGISPIAAMLLNKADEADTPDVEEAAPAAKPDVAKVPEAPIGQTVFQCLRSAPEHFQEMNGKTLDQIGKATLHALYGGKNSVGKKHVTPDILEKIENFLAA